MKTMRVLALGLGCLLGAWGPAQAGPTSFSFGLNVGVPAYRPYGYYHPYHPYYGPYYRPYPVYVAPAPVVVHEVPVVVEQRPVVVQPAPVVQPAYQARSATPEPTLAYSPSADEQAAVDRHLQMLTSADERVRSDSVMELGRLRAERAVEPLTATLAGDRSPLVRETAARALGLIGSPRGLTALTHAAQTDSDRDVRRSAQFAVEIIQSNPRR